jgi:hypothetical protein
MPRPQAFFQLAFYSTAVFVCWALLMLLSSAGHPYLVADVPYRAPYLGWAIPSAVHQWITPLLLAIFYWRALRWNAGTSIQIMLFIAAFSALVVVWLVTLARHDRLLSLFHVLLLLSVAWIALPRQRMGEILRVGVLAMLALPLAVLSYGAIWGETRCEEASKVRCLYTAGPRVRVPEFLAGIGVPVFADLRGVDLQAADLSDRDLRYADLRGADLKLADLSGSNLRRALIDRAVAGNSNWRGAYLDGASFLGADLNAAVMSRIHAYRVDFRGANLTNADLRNASLSHAYLAASKLNRALFNGTYMRFVEGLVDTQLAEACGDRETLLSPGFSIRLCPDHSGPRRQRP